MQNYLNHSPLNFHFAKNAKNFVVEEIPLYPFSGSGEHLILKIRKKNLTTFEMLNIISSNLGIKKSEIGYAGLKDKESLSIQHISINKKFAKNIESLKLENIKILDATFHNNKIKLGHLKGNKFFIRIKKLNKIDAIKLENACKIVSLNGMPNYFGMQRFGKFGDNFKQGEAILQNELKIKNKKISKFLISAFQSQLFNTWLEDRINFSKIINDFSLNDASKKLNIDKEIIKKLKNQKHFFKIIKGDICAHYPNGKYFYIGEINHNFDMSAENLETKMESLKYKNLKSTLEAKVESSLVSTHCLNSVYNADLTLKSNTSYKLDSNPSLESTPNLTLSLDSALESRLANSALNLDSTPILATNLESSNTLDSAIPSIDSSILSESERFFNHQIAPTGLLYGKKAIIAKSLALEFESNSINDLLKNELGSRRFAWVFVENLEFIYKEDIANGELNFALPKGSYATILLNTLANKNIDLKDEEK
ncbi:MAG: tRNA pseudouridine(13) synthase TruD [Helicobacteraceae bacterium]|nr:tRNA pseudouridine(13) synthase TruD [Helicobacteraceae bacterium]